MSSITGNDVQAAIIASMKGKSSITSLLSGSSDIKEMQWQGTDFVYPAVRVNVTMLPAVNGCLDTAEVSIEVYSEQKSSDQASTIAGAIYTSYHRHPFKQNGIQFPTVVVTRIDAPERSIYAWVSRIALKVQVA